MKLNAITLLVNNLDEALAFFRLKMCFKCLQDQQLTPNKRRIVVSPSEQDDVGLVLALASTDYERSLIGQQSGSKVFMFLTVDDIYATQQQYMAAGIEFVENPNRKPHGLVAVFLDVSGNRWDMIQPYCVDIPPRN